MQFRNAEEMVAWVLKHYEVAPLAEGDPILMELQRVERRGQLRDPDLILLALRKRHSEAEDPTPVG